LYDFILRDATIVSSRGRQVADVAIADGKIAYVGPRPPRSAQSEMSAMGKFLIPGVIDTAVQFDPNGDPGIWERESRAAVTGGVTTVIALPGGEHPVVDRQSAERRLNHARAGSWCDFALWAAAAVHNREEMGRALAEGLVAGQLACVGENELGIDVDTLASALEVEGVFGLRLDLDDGDAQGARRVLDTVRHADRQVHLLHLSTAAELAMIDPVRGDLAVTAGVTPHHLFLSVEESPMPVRTVPPVRPEHDRRTLWTAVRRGRLDCVASDHHAGPSDGTAGIPGTELLFPLMLSAVKYGRLGLESLVALCCEGPARVMGLEKKGRIERNCDADLVLFSEGEVTRIEQDGLMSGAGWSPYVQREAAPKPDLVLLRGRPVAMRGRLVSDKPFGRIATTPISA
jgi:dihydroorotase